MQQVLVYAEENTRWRCSRKKKAFSHFTFGLSFPTGMVYLQEENIIPVLIFENGKIAFFEKKFNEKTSISFKYHSYRTFQY